MNERITAQDIGLALMDCNPTSLRINLRDYIRIIEEGRTRMVDYYEQLEKEKSEPLSSVSALQPASTQETRIMS